MIVIGRGCMCKKKTKNNNNKENTNNNRGKGVERDNMGVKTNKKRERGERDEKSFDIWKEEIGEKREERQTYIPPPPREIYS